MIIELLETIHLMLESGLTWATIISIILAIAKLRESRNKFQRSEAMRRDIIAIKRHLGVEECAPISKPSKGNTVRRWLGNFTLLRMERSIVRFAKTFTIGRKLHMKQVNWITLVPALLGALKLILEPFGIHLSDENVNEIANGAAALATLIGVVMSHQRNNTVVIPSNESNK